jgi:hypothetical protein
MSEGVAQLRAFAALSSLSLSGAGCSAMYNLEAGYACGITENPVQSAVAVNANLGGGAGSDSSVAGAGVMVRTKFGPDLQQAALGSFAYAASRYRHVGTGAVYGALGLNLLQLENIRLAGENHFALGSLSPVAQIGLSLPYWVTLAIAGEYDVRFADVPGAAYVSLLVGIGGVTFVGWRPGGG